MTQVQESGSRARTRQAIVDAAIDLLGRNPAATLGEIAAAADVGRTTLHRYFAERTDLLAAVRAEAAARLEQATVRARVAEGTGAAAIRRLCQEYFDLGTVLSLIFEAAVVLDEDDGGGLSACTEPGFGELVERGHRDGSVDPELPAVWVQNFIWSQLYAAWSYLAMAGASRHEVLRLLLRTLDGAIAVKAV